LRTLLNRWAGVNAVVRYALVLAHQGEWQVLSGLSRRAHSAILDVMDPNHHDSGCSRAVRRSDRFFRLYRRCRQDGARSRRVDASALGSTVRATHAAPGPGADQPFVPVVIVVGVVVVADGPPVPTHRMPTTSGVWGAAAGSGAALTFPAR
jgi:hypothetical protein